MDKANNSAPRKPLRQQVHECMALWHQEALQGAAEGDISQIVLLGQMLVSGYGCTRDVEKGKHWLAQASKLNGSSVASMLPPPRGPSHVLSSLSLETLPMELRKQSSSNTSASGASQSVQRQGSSGAPPLRNFGQASFLNADAIVKQFLPPPVHGGGGGAGLGTQQQQRLHGVCSGSLAATSASGMVPVSPAACREVLRQQAIANADKELLRQQAADQELLRQVAATKVQQDKVLQQQ